MNRLVVRLLPAVLGLALCYGCAIAPAPDSADAKAARVNLQLGAGYMRSGHYDVALDKLKKALSYDETLAEAHNAIGLLYEQTGENKLAEQHYRRALALDAEFIPAILNYGLFLCGNGRPEEGEQRFLQAAGNPKLAEPDRAYIAAGTCARMQGDAERAQTHLQAALALNPTAQRALWQLAELNHEEGNDLEARAFLARYHDVAGYSPASLWLGVGIETAIGNQQQRLAYADLLQARFADSAEARRLNRSE